MEGCCVVPSTCARREPSLPVPLVDGRVESFFDFDFDFDFGFGFGFVSGPETPALDDGRELHAGRPFTEGGAHHIFRSVRRPCMSYSIIFFLELGPRLCVDTLFGCRRSGLDVGFT